MKPLSTSLLLGNLFLASVAWCAPAGVLLFAQEGTQILDASGAARPAKRGDVLQTGERLRTPAGGILQMRLPDGSLVGMRPGAELALDLPSVSAADPRKHVLALTQGSARVIGAELMDASKTSSFVFQSGLATLKLQGADLETAVVQPNAARANVAGSPGSYSRLLVGAGSIGNGALETPLAPRQVSFVGTVNVAPVTVTSVSPTLFAPTLTTLSPESTSTKLLASPTTTPSTTDRLAPSTTTSTLLTLAAGTTTTLIGPSTTTTTPIRQTAISPLPPTTTSPLVSSTPVAIAPVTVAPITVTPVVTSPILVAPPPPTKLPVLSCKILRTC